MEATSNDKIKQIKVLVTQLKETNIKLEAQVQKLSSANSLLLNDATKKEESVLLLQQQLQILLFSLDKMDEVEKKNFEKKINQFIKTIDGAIHVLTQ